jgi:hypothetical protein
MRVLIPRLEVVVARDKCRAFRLMNCLHLGAEVFLRPFSENFIQVYVNYENDNHLCLGLIHKPWSSRIISAQSTGRECRAWFVGSIPIEIARDGAFRLIISVWCSSLATEGRWSNLSTSYVLSASEGSLSLEEKYRSGQKNEFKATSQEKLADVTKSNSDSISTSLMADCASKISFSQSGARNLSDAQLELIRGAVRRKLAENE